MADRTRRTELGEGERPSVAVPPPATSVVPIAHVPPAVESTQGSSAHSPAIADASSSDSEAGASPAGRIERAVGLSLAIGGAGALLALAARTITTAYAGSLPYDAPSTLYTVAVSLLAATAAVCLTAWSPPPDPAASAEANRFRQVSLAALPIAAATIWLGFTIQGARDDARAYDEAERQAVSTSVLEHRAAERETHAMTQFALGAAYLRDRRFAEAESRLAYAFELDPHNERAAEFRRHAIAAKIAQSHPRTDAEHAVGRSESDETTLKIARYYASLLASGDHSQPVYEGILAGLRLEKRYDDAITLAGMYLAEHPGDAIWTARLAQLRDARLMDPGAIPAKPRAPAPRADGLATMRAKFARPSRDPWGEATFAYEYLKAALADRTSGRDSLLAAASRHNRRAIALAPNSAPYRVQLALIRFLARDQAGCDSALAEAVRLDPHILERLPEGMALDRLVKARRANQPITDGVALILTPPPRP